MTQSKTQSKQWTDADEDAYLMREFDFSKAVRMANSDIPPHKEYAITITRDGLPVEYRMGKQDGYEITISPYNIEIINAVAAALNRKLPEV